MDLFDIIILLFSLACLFLGIIMLSSGCKRKAIRIWGIIFIIIGALSLTLFIVIKSYIVDAVLTEDYKDFINKIVPQSTTTTTTKKEKSDGTLESHSNKCEMLLQIVDIAEGRKMKKPAQTITEKAKNFTRCGRILGTWWLENRK